ncbi:MAG: delta-60 repeat domain-containing protein, partial [Chitinophagales bacterium]|nr:delta-60 repeat domain-containing protein [Chitinophagales bacterium]
MKKLIFITACSLLIMNVYSQTPGELDPSFQHGQYFNGYVNKIIQLSDGKFVAGGVFTNYNDQFHQGIIKLNSDLTPDGSFNAKCPANSEVFALAEYPGNKILVGGDFEKWEGNPTYKMLVMLNADGTIDTTFTPGFNSVFNNEVLAIAIQPDGKILVGGIFRYYEGISRLNIVRLHADGSLDTTYFTGLGTLGDYVKDIEILEDGRILLGGRFLSVNGSACESIARLNIDGTNDTSFTLLGATKVTNINDIEMQADGKILIGGDFPGFASNIPTRNIARLLEDGTLDPAFDLVGITLPSDEIHEIIYEDDGKILIAGFIEEINGDPVGKIGRLNADGSTDTTFHAGIGAFFGFGTANYADVFDVLLLQDDTYMAVGEFSVFNGQVFGNIVKLMHNGDIDNSIPEDFGATGWDFTGVKTIVTADDGKIWIGGAFEAAGDVPSKGIAKLNADGSPDASFVANVEIDNTQVNRLAIQSDGKVIIGGSFITVDGVSKNKIARLNTDGTLDETFNIGTGFSFSIFDMALQPDGKILAGGGFSSYNGTVVKYLARLNTDGSLDASFPAAGGPDYIVNTLTLLSDGKILISGSFNKYNGVTRRYIARLNADGSLDATFDAGLEPDGSEHGVFNLAVQPDNKIVIAGEDFAKGSDEDDFMRLHADGSYDTTFINTTDDELGKDIYCVLSDENGLITIGGEFREYNNEEINKLVRLNPDGTRDETFTPLLGTSQINKQIEALALHDGQLIIGGFIGEYDTSTINNIAGIIYSTCSAPTGLFANNITPTKATAHWNNIPSADSYQIWVRPMSGGPWTK